MPLRMLPMLTEKTIYLLTIKIEYNMTKEIFTLSENAKLEYSCTVVQIGIFLYSSSNWGSKTC